MKPATLELKIPPVLLTVLFAGMMWLVSRFTPGVTTPPELRITAVLVFAVAGSFIGLAAVVSFRRAKTTVNPMTPEASSSLVEGGIFKLSRNPMYLALLLALIAWGFHLGNLYSLALTAVFIIYMNRFQIRSEEQALETAFGDEFREYKRGVRRWL
jgi:protein-S-isoprenylcysteine O-methyltransferase Ste14